MIKPANLNEYTEDFKTMSNRQLAEKYGVSQTTVKRWNKRYGLKRDDDHPSKSISKEPPREEFIKLVKSGLQQRKIAKHFGISQPLVRKYMKKFDVYEPSFTIENKVREHQLPDEIEFRKLNETMTDRELSEFYGVSRPTLTKWRKQFGFSKRKSLSGRWRKWELNETFFDVIDTELKAYALGLLASDGYVDTSNSVLSWSQKKSDAYILETIRDGLKSNRPITEHLFKDSEINGKVVHQREPLCRLTVSSKHLMQAVYKYGIFRAKSLQTHLPELPLEMMRHFLRGYWDGDGYVSKSHARLVAGWAFIHELRDFIDYDLGLELPDKAIRVRETEGYQTLWTLSPGKRSGFIQWLYEPSEVHLLRKYAVVKEHWL